jgi:6-phosphogluconolactonase (cycloisomerase 2 family)
VLVTGGFGGMTSFTVAPDGRLTRVNGSPFAGSQAISEIAGVAAINRRGRSFVYGAETKQNRIRGFEVQGDGSLVELPTSPFPAAPAPFALTTGETYLYATSQVLQQPGQISSYRVELDGTLVQPDGSPYTTWSTAITHAVTDPGMGRMVYTGCRWRERIYAYWRGGAAGRLRDILPGGISTGSFQPGRGIVQGYGNLVFAFSDDWQEPILSLRRDSTNGNLTPLSTLQVPAPGQWRITHGALHPAETFLAVIDQWGWVASVSINTSNGTMAHVKDEWLGLDWVTGILFVQP